MNSYPSKSINVSIHVLTWIGLFSMPYVVAYVTGSTPPPLDAGAIIMPVQVMVLFYLNYLWLINKYLFRKRIWVFVAINLAIIGLIAVAMFYIRHTFFAHPMVHEASRMEFKSKINLPAVMGVLTQFLVVVVSVAIKMTGKWYEVRQRVQELEKINAQAELQQLKTQLNPHFLFNSLNNIYALIAFDADKAQISLHSLCDMLRYQLYEANRETIPLDKEIDFVRSYCDLMRLRLPAHVALSVDMPTNTTGINLAPLLFVSIVENAFKHGVSQSAKSYISIKIVVENDHLICLVKNSYYPKTDRDRSGSGIGLENLRRRLELLYPETHSFRAEKTGDEFVAQLTIRINS